ncbi:hypothetical protein CEP50_02550 [Actinopolyspora mortivallis]|uniref:Uncharacterized protein n=1 Tax=Actinopolyspora mortivallis TaxID=33906 RepID=A0A2T0H044_ACTMO|nr:hypothetical protein CEP50_02550 [Actinopolyspora mortivallis]
MGRHSAYSVAVAAGNHDFSASMPARHRDVTPARLTAAPSGQLCRMSSMLLLRARCGFVTVDLAGPGHRE